MKKVLFYIRECFGGGAEKILLEYVKKLDKEKFDITVMVRRKNGAFLDKFEKLKEDGVRFERAFDYLKPGKNVFQKLYNVVISKLGDFCEFRFPSVFYRLAIKEKYDAEIAFMHNEAASIIASSSNRRSLKLMWVHTDLRRITTWKQYFRTRKRQKKFFEKFDHCICVSNLAKDALKDLLDVDKNVKVIHNPVDHQTVTRLSEAYVPFEKSDMMTVCSVGRLSFEKNYSMLLDVHAKLIKNGFLHRLYIVGDGPEKQMLSEKIKTLGIEDTAFLAGFKENPYPYVKNSDLFVCSSVYEGLSAATQEAIVLGKAIVSSCAVVKENFGKYECGIITENTPEGLYEGMVKMLTDKESYAFYQKESEKRSEELKSNTCIKEVEDLIMQG